MGSDEWDQTLHEVVQENITDASDYVTLLFSNRIDGHPTEPPKNYQQTKEFCLKVVKLVQGMAEKRGNKFIIGNEV